jgi:hypothetical protein
MRVPAVRWGFAAFHTEGIVRGPESKTRVSDCRERRPDLAHVSARDGVNIEREIRTLRRGNCIGRQQKPAQEAYDEEGRGCVRRGDLSRWTEEPSGLVDLRV